MPSESPVENHTSEETEIDENKTSAKRKTKITMTTAATTTTTTTTTSKYRCTTCSKHTA
jgi:hypothetical protein